MKVFVALFDETVLAQRIGRLAVFVVRDRSLLAAAVQQDAVRRIAEREDFLQHVEIERSYGFQAGLPKKSGRETGLLRWDSDDGNVALPVKLGHRPGGSVAMPAVRIVEKQESAPMLEAIRLAVDGDGLGSFGSGQMGVCVAVADPGEYRDGAEHYGGAALAGRRTCP